MSHPHAADDALTLEARRADVLHDRELAEAELRRLFTDMTTVARTDRYDADEYVAIFEAAATDRGFSAIGLRSWVDRAFTRGEMRVTLRSEHMHGRC